MRVWSKNQNILVEEDEEYEELNLSEDRGELIWQGDIKDFFKGLKALKKRGKEDTECPQVHEATRVCVCVDCPRKEDGKCWPEKLCRVSGCQGYVLSCSLRSEVSSGTSPLFGKFVCDEWGQHLNRKFEIK